MPCHTLQEIIIAFLSGFAVGVVVVVVFVMSNIAKD